MGDITPRKITLFDLDDKPVHQITTSPMPFGAVVVWQGRKFQIGGPGSYYTEFQAGEI